MSLSLETSLHAIATTLRERIMPALDDSYASEVARLATMLLTISASAVDGAAAVCVAENAAIRNLYRDATGVVDDNDLTARLNEAAGSTDPALTLTALDVENGRLRALLVVLHAHVETQTQDTARAIDRRIWSMLKEFEAARAPRA